MEAPASSLCSIFQRHGACTTPAASQLCGRRRPTYRLPDAALMPPITGRRRLIVHCQTPDLTLGECGRTFRSDLRSQVAQFADPLSSRLPLLQRWLDHSTGSSQAKYLVLAAVASVALLDESYDRSRPYGRDCQFAFARSDVHSVPVPFQSAATSKQPPGALVTAAACDRQLTDDPIWP